ncbi:MAG: HupE/UreJ family protein [Methylocystis sp.]|uniref:HupE/UreJ family protein n=1 Tax=Methylocystis sp. TaxID=1911079 RepID=UPI0039310C2F
MAAIVMIVGLCFGATARAHFKLNMNVRIIHVEHLGDGLRVYLRTPMPYLVGDKTGPVGEDGLPQPAPFTTNRKEGERTVHFVDAASLRSDPLGLGQIAAEGLQLEVDGRVLEPIVVMLRVYPIGQEPDFATLEEARSALHQGHPIFPKDTPDAYVGDTIVDVLVRYDAAATINNYELSSRLDPGLPGQEETANLILDHGPGGAKVFRTRGLMRAPVMITRSTFAAASTFIWEGVRHILGGFDHVLFVLCLVLGATGFGSLISRATGFTVGHSVTLTAGFFGYVPKGTWFAPTVETGIALSIIYAAVIALMPLQERAGRARRMFLVTAAIGLLHGLGFSFVLHEILKIDSPDIWQSLLSFNLGVEIGQLAIVIAVWPTLLLLQRANENAWRIGRICLATGCIAVAAFWSVERVAGGISIL